MEHKKFLWTVTSMVFSILFLVSCFKDDEPGNEKVIGYKEYTLIVASQKVPGLISSCGHSLLTEVYPAKKNAKDEWFSFPGEIKVFHHEYGYEYVIRISETTYLDNRKGDPQWTEYELIEIIKKTAQESEGLPEHFIPQWYDMK